MDGTKHEKLLNESISNNLSHVHAKTTSSVNTFLVPKMGLLNHGDRARRCGKVWFFFQGKGSRRFPTLLVGVQMGKNTWRQKSQQMQQLVETRKDYEEKLKAFKGEGCVFPYWEVACPGSDAGSGLMEDSGARDTRLEWVSNLSHLVAWAAQASEVFAAEIQHASRWHTTIPVTSLSAQQRSRASKLFAILKAAFSGHARTSMLISVFAEGLDLHERTGTVVSVGQANSNGFGLARQLSTEFSLRSRGEALTLI